MFTATGKVFGRKPQVWLAALNAVIAMLVGFGLPLTGAQVGLVMAAVSAAMVVLTGATVVKGVEAGRIPAKQPVVVDSTDVAS